MNRNECEHGQLRRSCELCELQSTVNAQQDTIGALKRKLFLAESEAEALRQRIESAPRGVVSNRHSSGVPDIVQPLDDLPGDLWGKRVRIVVEGGGGRACVEAAMREGK